MELSLKDKVCVVAGASKGIGREITSIFARSNALVVAVSRKESNLIDSVERINSELGEVCVHPVAADVSEPEGLDKVIEYCSRNFGCPQILVNNAAANPYFGTLTGIDDFAIRKTLNVNLEAVHMWISRFWETFWSKSDEMASCINIASIGGLNVESGLGIYNVSKAAVLHLTRQFAFELGPRVRVNSISPGLIKTDFARILWDGRQDRIADGLPMRRIGVPGDVAGAALYLASDLSSWMTGSNLVIDGGASVMPSDLL